MNKVLFDQALRASRINHPDWRPFLCSGHPTDESLLIIGLNPATPGLPDWWDFWDLDTGLDLVGIEKASQAFRNGKSSPTRNRLNYLRSGLATNRHCIEANLYPIASTKLSAMPKIGRNTKHLDLLLEMCSPKVIYVHGSEPSKYIANKMGITLPLVHRGKCDGPFISSNKNQVVFFSCQAAYGPGNEAMHTIGIHIDSLLSR